MLIHSHHHRALLQVTTDVELGSDLKRAVDSYSAPQRIGNVVPRGRCHVNPGCPNEAEDHQTGMAGYRLESARSARRLRTMKARTHWFPIYVSAWKDFESELMHSDASRISALIGTLWLSIPYTALPRLRHPAMTRAGWKATDRARLGRTLSDPASRRNGGAMRYEHRSQDVRIEGGRSEHQPIDATAEMLVQAAGL